MGNGWSLDKILKDRTAEEFVRDHFPNASFNEIYGQIVCVVPDHFVTEEQTPFFQSFKKMFQVDLKKKVVELKPLRGVGETVELSARNALQQIFDFDPQNITYGQSRLVRYSELMGRESRPVAGKRYRVYAKDNVPAEGRPQTKVSLASTFNATGIIDVVNYHITPKGESHKYDTGFMLSPREGLYLVPHDRAN